MLSTVETILEKEVPSAVAYLRAHSFGPRLYAWPILQSAFSEVLGREDWLCVWDHLLTHHNKPELLLYFLAGFLILQSEALQAATTATQLHLFVSREHGVSGKAVVKKGWELYHRHSSQGEVGRDLAYKSALPMPASSYPIFDSFPKYLVEEKEHLRDQVIREEKEFQKR